MMFAILAMLYQAMLSMSFYKSHDIDFATFIFTSIRLVYIGISLAHLTRGIFSHKFIVVFSWIFGLYELVIIGSDSFELFLKYYALTTY